MRQATFSLKLITLVAVLIDDDLTEASSRPKQSIVKQSLIN